MTKRTFELPDLGEGIAEGELVSWAVEPGDHVEEDQLVAEVETDKALVEIPSPYDGTVTELHAEEGEVVPVDSVVVTFDVDDADGEASDDTVSEETTADDGTTEGEAPDDTVAEDDGAADEPEASATPPDQPTDASATGSDASDGQVFASPSTRRLARDLGVDLSTVPGSGPGGRVEAADVRQAAESGGDPASSGGTASASADETSPAEADAAAADAGKPDAGGTNGAAVGGTEAAGRERTLAMPATRRIAREGGVDIDDVPASEQREGEAFVTAADVEAYLGSGETAQAESTTATDELESAAAATTSEPEATTTNGAASGSEPTSLDESASGERIPYKGIRRTIGEQMARSKYTAPHVSHHDRFDAAALVDIRAELAEVAAEEDVNLTYLPFVVKAVVAALKEFPSVNSSLDEEAEEIVLRDEYNIGIAVATDAGLMVPVVKHADRKGLKQLAVEIDDLATRARERELSREEMQGGTFTITNVGVIGGEFSSPIINHPEAGILAMGPIEKRPWVVDDEVVARETMTLSMSVDHRLVDGAEAAGFTNRVMALLGDPARLLLE